MCQLSTTAENHSMFGPLFNLDLTQRRKNGRRRNTKVCNFMSQTTVLPSATQTSNHTTATDMSEPSTASSHNACFLGDTSISHPPIVILYIHTWTIEFVNIQAGLHHTGRSDRSIQFVHSVKTHERHCQNTSVKSCKDQKVSSYKAPHKM